MTATVSVVLPFRNAERWLGKALRSLRQQTSKIFEIIAIDDGSDDLSGHIVEVEATRGLPIRLIRAERHYGIVHSLNLGLAAAKGQFIARMDADDVCAPNRLQRQLAFLNQTGIDICGSWFVEFGQGIRRTVRWPTSETALRAAMLFQNPLCHPTIMARREVFEQFNYRYDYQLAEDYDLFGRASAKFRIANVPEPLLLYRRHPQQATRAKRDAMEHVTRRIRIEVLRARGFDPTVEEQRLHNLIRAPQSIITVEDLSGIESWLSELYLSHDEPDARRVIASQWVRACIRAAPLGRAMWDLFRGSKLHPLAGQGRNANLDLRILSILRLGYGSRPFELLRRFGLSA